MTSRFALPHQLVGFLVLCFCDQDIGVMTGNGQFFECPDGRICSDDETCCQASSGNYGCCPFSMASIDRQTRWISVWDKVDCASTVQDSRSMMCIYCKLNRKFHVQFGRTKLDTWIPTKRSQVEQTIVVFRTMKDRWQTNEKGAAVTDTPKRTQENSLWCR